MYLLTITTSLAGLTLVFAPLFFVLWRIHSLQKKELAESKSPFSQKLLRPAGESLRLEIDKIREQMDECLFSLVYTLLAPGVFCLIISKLALAAVFVFTSIACAIAWTIAWFKWKKLRGLRKELNNHRLGFDGERCVGAELTPLLTKGYHVFHDFVFDMVPGGEKTTFNIDHIAVGLEGVFIIETKAKRKSLKPPVNELAPHEIAIESTSSEGVVLRFPNGYRDSKPIAQARRQADQWRAWLNLPNITAKEVRPIVVYPGWWVKSEKWRLLGVQSASKLAHRLPQLGRGRRLTPQEVQHIAARLEDKCRTIEGAL